MHRYDIDLDENADDALNLLAKEIPDGCSVLELGCGNGRFTRYLAERKMCRVSIVDYDSYLFDKARDHASLTVCARISQRRNGKNTTGEWCLTGSCSPTCWNT